MTTTTNSTAIAIFVKTPSLSPLKTRLAAGVGEDAAQAFYRLSLKAVEATAQTKKLTPYWAVGEEDGLEHPLWKNFSRLHTGDGNLGQRQHHVYETLLKTHDRVLLIGADAPQLSRDLLEQAMLALDENDFVIGPARDGGYYLFGGRVSTSADVWKNVPWSTAMTRERLEAGLGASIPYLALLTDVDTQSDLQRMVAEMPGALSEPQKQLRAWVKNLRAATTQ